MGVVFPVHTQTRLMIVPTLLLQTMETRSLKVECFSSLLTSQGLVSPVKADIS